MATHSSVLAWRIPGTEEPSGLPSVGSQSQTRLKRLSSSSSSSSLIEDVQPLVNLLASAGNTYRIFNHIHGWSDYLIVTTTWVQSTEFSFSFFHLEPPGLETPRDLTQSPNWHLAQKQWVPEVRERENEKQKLCSYRRGGFSHKEVREGRGWGLGPMKEFRE